MRQGGADALFEDEGRGRRIVDILLLRGQAVRVGIEARREERCALLIGTPAELRVEEVADAIQVTPAAFTVG